MFEGGYCMQFQDMFFLGVLVMETAFFIPVQRTKPSEGALKCSFMVKKNNRSHHNLYSYHKLNVLLYRIHDDKHYN